jgi:hypothetical protein
MTTPSGYPSERDPMALLREHTHAGLRIFYRSGRLEGSKALHLLPGCGRGDGVRSQIDLLLQHRHRARPPRFPADRWNHGQYGRTHGPYDHRLRHSWHEELSGICGAPKSTTKRMVGDHHRSRPFTPTGRVRPTVCSSLLGLPAGAAIATPFGVNPAVADALLASRSTRTRDASRQTLKTV